MDWVALEGLQMAPLALGVGTALLRLGIDFSKEARQVSAQVNAYLDEQYNFSRPKHAPMLAGRFFWNVIRCETVGARQFVLERGMFQGVYYRIQERRDVLSFMKYFVWDRFESEDQAIDQWNGFIGLLQAREFLGAQIASGAGERLVPILPGQTSGRNEQGLSLPSAEEELLRLPGGSVLDTIACPYCAESIKAAAKLCKHCRSKL